jgi:hypothetical protein
MSPTTRDTLHKEYQLKKDDERNSDESDDDSFELTTPTEQEIAEEKIIEQQYEFQYNATTKYRARPTTKKKVHSKCEDTDDEMPELLDTGDQESDTSSTSSEEQEWEEIEKETPGYRQTRLKRTEVIDDIINPYLIPVIVIQRTKKKDAKKQLRQTKITESTKNPKLDPNLHYGDSSEWKNEDTFRLYFQNPDGLKSANSYEEMQDICLSADGAEIDCHFLRDRQLVTTT